MANTISGTSTLFPPLIVSNSNTMTTLGNGNGNGPPTAQPLVDTVTLSDEAKLLLENEQSTVTTLGNGNGNGPPVGQD